MTTASEQEKTGDNLAATILKEARNRRTEDAAAIALVIVALSGSLLAIFFAQDLANLVTTRYSYETERYRENLASNTAIIRILGATIGIITLGFLTYLYAAGSSVLKRRQSVTKSSTKTPIP